MMCIGHLYIKNSSVWLLITRLQPPFIHPKNLCSKVFYQLETLILPSFFMNAPKKIIKLS